MDRWAGRVALVTGASAGIGAEVAKELVRKGMKVVGCGRRVERIQAFADELKGQPGKLYAVKCDVSKEQDILNMFSWIKENLKGVDVCINNAGVAAFKDSLMAGKTETWRQLLDVNVLAPSICSREALKSMKERGVDDGHIIHITSTLGHNVMNFPSSHFYSGTKFALEALTEGMRQELAASGSNIRITAISPGLVFSEMTAPFLNASVAVEGIDPKNMSFLQPKDLADSVVYVLSAPPTVQVHQLMIRPTKDGT